MKDLWFTLGDRVQVSYAQEIIVMAECSDKGATQRATYGAVDVEAEGEKPALVKVDTAEIELEFRNLEASRHYLFALSPMLAGSPVLRPHATIKNNPSYEITSRPEGWLRRICNPRSTGLGQPRDDVPTSLLLMSDRCVLGTQ